MLEAMLSKKKGDGVNYTNFLAAISGYQEITSGNTVGTAEGYRKLTMASPGGTMWGTPWGNRFTYDSQITRVAQHCLPDITTLNETIGSRRVVLFKFHYIASQSSYVSLARNNYTSLAYGTFNGQQVLDFLYYDAARGEVMRVNPLLASTPIPWDGSFV